MSFSFAYDKIHNMKAISEIIAQNLIKLRKQNHLTQSEFAEKLNYSDNTISRWEHAEITPSVETLEQISNLFNVKIEALLQENGLETQKAESKNYLTRVRVTTNILAATIVWFVALLCFFFVQTFAKTSLWTLFVWAVPASCLVVLLLTLKWSPKVFKFVFSSVLVWSFCTALYLQFLAHNLYLLFIFGIPIQVALAVWFFVRKKRS